MLRNPIFLVIFQGGGGGPAPPLDPPMIKCYIFITGTCEVLDIRECSASDEFIDPCNCYDTYSCVNLEVIRRTCPQGTAFDGKRCDHENDVLLYDCDTDLPWERCNVSGKISNSHPSNHIK